MGASRAPSVGNVVGRFPIPEDIVYFHRLYFDFLNEVIIRKLLHQTSNNSDRQMFMFSIIY